MPHDACDRVSELFAAGACDWTPAGAGHAVRVLYAPVMRDALATSRCAHVLSNAEVRRAERFVTEEGKALFTQRRAFRRYCGALALCSWRPLEQINFEETAQGRPYLAEAPGLWLSFSSCRHGYLAAWSWTHAVGVDIEDRTRRLEATELAQRYFTEAEARAVAEAESSARRQLFLKLWTLKEAALKSIGEGLPFGLDAFAFDIAATLRIAQAPAGHGGPERFDAHIVEGADTCAGVIVRTAIDEQTAF